MVTVVAFNTDHRVSTYRLPARAEAPSQLRDQRRPSCLSGDKAAGPECRKSRVEPAKDSSILESMNIFMSLSYAITLSSSVSFICYIVQLNVFFNVIKKSQK